MNSQIKSTEAIGVEQNAVIEQEEVVDNKEVLNTEDNTSLDSTDSVPIPTLPITRTMNFWSYRSTDTTVAPSLTLHLLFSNSLFIIIHNFALTYCVMYEKDSLLFKYFVFACIAFVITGSLCQIILHGINIRKHKEDRNNQSDKFFSPCTTFSIFFPLSVIIIELSMFLITIFLRLYTGQGCALENCLINIIYNLFSKDKIINNECQSCCEKYKYENHQGQCISNRNHNILHSSLVPIAGAIISLIIIGIKRRSKMNIPIYPKWDEVLMVDKKENEEQPTYSLIKMDAWAKYNIIFSYFSLFFTCISSFFLAWQWGIIDAKGKSRESGYPPLSVN